MAKYLVKARVFDYKEYAREIEANTKEDAETKALLELEFNRGSFDGAGSPWKKGFSKGDTDLRAQKKGWG